MNNFIKITESFEDFINEDKFLKREIAIYGKKQWNKIYKEMEAYINNNFNSWSDAHNSFTSDDEFINDFFDNTDYTDKEAIDYEEMAFIAASQLVG